jgi:hypothetical protein
MAIRGAGSLMTGVVYFLYKRHTPSEHMPLSLPANLVEGTPKPPKGSLGALNCQVL